MAGTFPATANAQQHDVNGRPLAGALLTVYQGGSTSALANVFQDIGLVIPASNPLVADATGRLPLFFVADGTYGLRLTDQFGTQANGGFFYPQVPSIGASSSGGGGTPVDPTTVFSTGDYKFRPAPGTLTGWVRLNGHTIGNASSGASERANADTQALFIYIWTTFSNPTANLMCPVVGGLGANALADFNANKQITLLDGRGRAMFGVDDMGNAPLGAFTGVVFTIENSVTGGASGGSNSTTLTASQIPAITSGNTAPIGLGVTSVTANTATGSIISFNNAAGGGSARIFGSDGVNQQISSTGIIGAGAAAVTSTNTGGQSFPSMPSFLLGVHFWKL